MHKCYLLGDSIAIQNSNWLFEFEIYILKKGQNICTSVEFGGQVSTTNRQLADLLLLKKYPRKFAWHHRDRDNRYYESLPLTLNCATYCHAVNLLLVSPINKISSKENMTRYKGEPLSRLSTPLSNDGVLCLRVFGCNFDLF